MLIHHFEQNTRGRDYVVGDIHGHFSRLHSQLDRFFNPETDRLFSVGDLVDRGPESHLAADWLNQPWFHSVLGNHEQLIIDAHSGDRGSIGCSVMNGGKWFQELDHNSRDRIVGCLMNLPFGISVDTAHGLVGIVHADIPYNCWSQFKNSIKDSRVKNYALWSRDRVRGEVKFTIQDLVALYVGHTPVKTGTVLDGNIHYMDNGAWGSRSDDGKIFQIKQIN